MNDAIQSACVVVVFAVGTLGMACLFLLLLGWFTERLVIWLKIKRAVIGYYANKEKFDAWMGGGKEEP